MSKSRPVEIRRCLICGEVFAINTQQYNKIYCCDCKPVVAAVRSKDYVKANYKKIKERAKQRYIPHTHTYICQICGKENIAKQGATKYCLECLKIAKGKLRNYYCNRSANNEQN